MKNIWKEIEGSRGMYFVSNTGLIKSMYSHRGRKPGYILSPRKHNGGYVIYNLNLGIKFKNYLIHRIVATAFLPNPFNKKFVNHIDGDKKNNNLSNLEWVTKSENVLHAFKIGLMKPNYSMLGKTHLGIKGSNNPCSRTIQQFFKDGTFIKQWGCISEAARELGLSSGNIVMNCQGKLKSTGGFCFKYA